MQRSDPLGMTVRFEAESSAVDRVDVGLNDGDDVLSADINLRDAITGQITRPGGAYYRGLIYKPVRNGTWSLVLRGYQRNTLVATTTCADAVTVAP